MNSSDSINETKNTTSNSSNTTQNQHSDSSNKDQTNHNTSPSGSNNVSDKSINEKRNDVKGLANTEEVKGLKTLDKIKTFASHVGEGLKFGTSMLIDGTPLNPTSLDAREIVNMPSDKKINEWFDKNIHYDANLAKIPTTHIPTTHIPTTHIPTTSHDVIQAFDSQIRQETATKDIAIMPIIKN
jgi:hypothetical protein